MRNNTQRIYERLSRGEFLSVDSTDTSIRHLYEDIEENMEDYTDYFKEIGLQLECGNGFFYFSRKGESKQTIEQKLESFSKWLDYLDFLKCYNQSFTAGYQFRKSHLIEQISLDIELKEKARNLYTEFKTHDEKMNRLINDLERQGFIELENELDETYKVTAAFHYIEELIDCLTIIETEQV